MIIKRSKFLIHRITQMNLKHIICFFTLKNLSLIGRYLLYNSLLFFAICQHKSAIGIHMSPTSWTSLQPSTLSHPSRLSQSTGLRFLCHTANSHQISILHMVIYMFLCFTLNSFHPLLLCVQKFVFYVCIFMAALQIDSSVLSS